MHGTNQAVPFSWNSDTSVDWLDRLDRQSNKSVSLHWIWLGHPPIDPHFESADQYTLAVHFLLGIHSGTVAVPTYRSFLRRSVYSNRILDLSWPGRSSSWKFSTVSISEWVFEAIAVRRSECVFVEKFHRSIVWPFWCQNSIYRRWNEPTTLAQLYHHNHELVCRPLWFLVVLLMPQRCSPDTLLGIRSLSVDDRN